MKKIDKYIKMIIIALVIVLSATLLTVALYKNRQSELPSESMSVATLHPSATPSAETTPAKTPPAETPTPPAESPAIESPPVETPPVESPPAVSPPPIIQPADENIKYVKEDESKTFTSYEEPREVLFSLDMGKPVYLKNSITDSNGKIISYQISEDEEGKDLGYINPTSLVSSKTELMGIVYDDVDYSGFAKNTFYDSNPRVEVRGIYVSASTASIPSKVDELIRLANETDINAFVINVKDDNENMLFRSVAAEKYCPSANDSVFIKDIASFIKKLKDNNIYLIARIVTFKSPKYAIENPEKAIVFKESGEMYYKDKSFWASPYDRNLWEYNVEVAKEAISLGFNEIQFDYVRFPDNGAEMDPLLDFRNVLSESKTRAIQGFLKYAYQQISELEAYVAADLYAWAATSESDLGIGQQWEALTNYVDYICPMMYPSHYGPGIYGLDVPDAHPYETIFESSSDAIMRNQMSMSPATIRPWIQDFTATWVKGHITYGADEVFAEIKALKDNGINEYMLWNPSNSYTEGALNND